MSRSDLQDQPSVEQIRELYQYVTTSSAWRSQQLQDKQFLDFYFGENPIEADDTANRKRRRRIEPERMATGEAARVIDRIASFYALPPSFSTVFTGEQGTHSETLAERTGRAYNEAFEQLNSRGDTPWTDGVWSQVLLGRSADLILPGHEYYWDFPLKGLGQTETQWSELHASWRRKAPLPVVWFSLPAESTFPASLATVEDQAISWQRLTWLDLADIFSERELRGSGAPEARDRKAWLKDVTLGIYSNRRWLAYAVLTESAGQNAQDKILRSIEHKLERCAIRILPGMTTGRRQPPYYWKSVLSSAKELLVAADRLATRAGASAKFNAYPLLKEHRNNAGGSVDQGLGAKGETEEYMEGDSIVLDAGDKLSGREREDIAPVLQPEHGKDTKELLIMWLERIARMTAATDAMDGSQGVGSQPAWSVNFKAEIAKGQLRPLTTNISRRGIDLAECLGRAVIAFDEPIWLAKLDDSGNRRGDLVLVPKDLARYQPVIKVEYKVQIPINMRADYNLGMDLMIQSKTQGVPLNYQWVYENLMGVENFWTDVYQPYLKVMFMLSPEIIKIQTQSIANDFEAQIAQDSGMSMEEFVKVADQLPEPFRSNAIQFAQSQMGGQQLALPPPQGQVAGAIGNPAGVTSNPGMNIGRTMVRSALNAATRGAFRAGSPFSARPGGPQPQEIGPV